MFTNVVGAYGALTSQARIMEVGTADTRVWVLPPAGVAARGAVCLLVAGPRLRRE